MRKKVLCVVSIILSLMFFQACIAIPKAVDQAACIKSSDTELNRAIDSGNLEQVKEALEDGLTSIR